MKYKLIWFVFFILSISILTFSILYQKNHLYFSVGMGLSYLFWSFAFIFSTPFHWTYKVEEAIYVTWFIGLASYFYYAEMTIALIIFLIPILIHYMAWGRKQEEKALYYMLVQIEETKDQKLFQTFSNEVKKRHLSFSSPYWWITTLGKLQKMMKEEAEKQNHESQKNKQ